MKERNEKIIYGRKDRQTLTKETSGRGGGGEKTTYRGEKGG